MAATDNDRHEHLRAAQATGLADLTQRTQDRPAHRRYLDALLAVEPNAMPEVPVPPGVAVKAADALLEDVDWCRMPPPELGHSSPYSNAYDAYRTASSRAQSARKRTMAQRTSGHPLGELLSFDP